MSWLPDADPKPGDPKSCDLIEQVIVPRARDLGGFEVRRALPRRRQQMVGPFIFFDQMGPAEFLLGQGIDVRPHPHIGLATVTYLFDGEIMHRDSLGHRAADQARRAEPDDRRPRHRPFRTHRARRCKATGPRLFGIQAWVALPKSHEESAARLRPSRRRRTAAHRGRGQARAPHHGLAVTAKPRPRNFPHDCFYAEAVLAPGAVLPLDPDYDERGVYIVSGEIDIAGETFGPGRLLVFRPGDRISILARSRKPA